MATKKVKHQNGLEFYRDKNNEIQWRIWQSGVIIHGSTEGYKRIESVKSNLKSFIRALGYNAESEFTSGAQIIGAAAEAFKKKAA